MTQDNINRAGFACRAINEAMREAVSGVRAYDMRTPIEEVKITFDDRNPKFLLVSIQCRGMANQPFTILLDDEKKTNAADD